MNIICAVVYSLSPQFKFFPRDETFLSISNIYRFDKVALKTFSGAGSEPGKYHQGKSLVK